MLDIDDFVTKYVREKGEGKVKKNENGRKKNKL